MGYVAILPALSIITEFWIIYSTAFDTQKTLCCYSGWMIGHVLLLLPTFGLCISAFVNLSIDPSMMPLAQLFSMIFILQKFSIIGYI